MPAGVTVEQLHERLEARGCRPKPNRQGWEALCPAHGDDKTRHLYYRRGDRSELILYCHKGCAFEAILKALGLDHQPMGLPVAKDGGLTTWTYRDADGQPAYQNCRGVRVVDGKEEKYYFQRRWDANTNRWVNNLQGVQRIPYRLPELIQANPNRMVLLGEGEKVAELLAKTGYAATTTAEGAGKARNTPELLYYLRGRSVAIFPDYDEAGIKHAQDVKAFLTGAGIHAEYVRIDPKWKVTTKHGKDIVDWVEGEGHSLDEVIALAQAALSEAGERPPAMAKDKAHSRPIPVLEPEGYYGLAGRVVETVAPITESTLPAVVANFLVTFGVAAGRGLHARVGATRHHLNEFAMLVGDSGAGKGSSHDPVKDLFARVDPTWAKHNVITGGLSSGEGVINAVRDKITKEKLDQKTGTMSVEVVDEGVADKRVLFVQTEFGGVLINMSRAGNNLSALMRAAWDGSTLQTLTRNPLRATDPHIGILAHVTPKDLHEHLEPVEIANGLLNRFLMIDVRRRQNLPHGGGYANLNPLVQELAQTLAFARTMGPLERSPEANFIWEKLYPYLVDSREGEIDTIIQRRRAHVLRASGMYASTDTLRLISADHLMAAIALWQFSEATVCYYFADVIPDKTQAKIVAELKSRPGGLPRQMLRELLGRGIRGLDKAIDSLEDSGRIFSEGRVGSGGREVPFYFAAADQELGAFDYMAVARDAYAELVAAGGVPKGYKFDPSLHVEEEELAEAEPFLFEEQEDVEDTGAADEQP